MLKYSYTLTRDTNGTFLVQFPDIPEAVTVGDTREDARINAREALEAALEIYFDQKRAIPLPSTTPRGSESIVLPALVTAKVLLANEMIAQGIRKAELARRMGLHMPQIDRLLDLRHSSKIETVEAALQQLGRQLDVQVV
ncbi:HicB family protein [Pigmentiphaga sp. NML080357]|uniref:type II toxin-antitoxin system HicB family antitoxin n=1 Tax=Pigmentiphaga sp. NML080357 TaxID=2008675 RepID=UPI000B417E97|nr:type II toxin-antitoxin system HicB family antitoxin [Pigmentiphaga sp. NML080357]OVZ61155.1 HicB family protein [Pigmentiphaga sp. NML080357]